ncbi:DEAH (Asp-Glu-Ala-His) box polypeptide 34 [Globomyces sp. JEL0801]|nr:DEAH (Asp-Glu-Ala-His) box polypeptide 34 [Globomyces sp. JEL0801]
MSVPNPNAKPPWNRDADKFYFGYNTGIARFKKYSAEYDEFLCKFKSTIFDGFLQMPIRYTLASIKVKPGRHTDEYLQTVLDVFSQFQAKKLEKLRIKIEKDRKELPVYQFEKDIVEAVKTNQVILIAADTGAGKSTQVPQYLMAAGFNNIACTQPRRIACYSLAKRVSYESLNQYGSEVAYQVRFDGTKTEHTRVLFLTEASDFLLGILKGILNYRQDIRLVLMSATINAQLFSDYFNAPVIEIPGRMFPVTIEYCEVEEEDTALTDESLLKERREGEKQSIASRGKKIQAGMQSGSYPNQGPYLKIMEKIDQLVPSTERGDLLIFVSGMNEIGILSEELRSYATYTRRWIILELHSALSVLEQEKAFDIAPEGVRKCIISTNIAETSVTIDGIRFIIDSGKVKEIGHDHLIGISKLSEFWISQSSAKQRSGRAGRTGPGKVYYLSLYCYRFYSKKEYEGMNDFPIPEILRMPLDSIILEIKSFGLGDPREFDFIERPSEVNIAASLEKLHNLGCIDWNENITDLGRVLAALPVDAVLGKMLVLGTISELLGPVVAIAAVLSVQSPFTRVSESENRISEKRRNFHSTHGDPFTLMNLFSGWLESKSDKDVQSRKWCKQRGVEEQRMYEIVKLKNQFEKMLDSYTGSTKKLKLQDDEQLSEEDNKMLSRLSGMPNYQRKFQKRMLEKRKRETITSTRKFLKLDENTVVKSDGDDDDESEGNTLATLHKKRMQKEVLCYLQLLETTKPYLMNVMRIPALPMALLFANQVDITSDFLHLIVDEWLDIEFTSKEDSMRMLELGNWLRYGWLTVVNRKLEVATMAPSFGGLGTRMDFDKNDTDEPSDAKQTIKDVIQLESLGHIPETISEMRQCWHRFAQTGLSSDGPIEDEDVMNRLVELVDTDVDYTCKKLKMSHISDLFGYDPYNGEARVKNVVHVTPNFKYYVRVEDIPKGRKGYALPRVVKQPFMLALNEKTVSSKKQVDVLPSTEETPNDTLRKPFECSICSKDLLLTTKMPKESCDCRQNAIVHESRGPPDDQMNFYSTTNSTTHRDWLPTLATKFNLHLSTKPLPEKLSDPLPPKSRKQQTGYSKNCISFVQYDPEVDETDTKFSELAFITDYDSTYKTPKRPTSENFGKSEFVTQEILDSGFTTIPKFSVIEQGKNYEKPPSEMKSQFNRKDCLKGSDFSKLNIAPCSSAFTNDVEHIHQFGFSNSSPFEKEPIKTVPNTISGYPTLMKADGYTNSVRQGLIASQPMPDLLLNEDIERKVMRSDPQRWLAAHDNGKSTSSQYHCDLQPMKKTLALHNPEVKVGNKQNTGSIRNNHPYKETFESNPTDRFLSESSDRFAPIKKDTSIRVDCNMIPRSGFTLCNKFQYNYPILDDGTAGPGLDETVSKYQTAKIKNIYAPKPTGIRHPRVVGRT